MGLLLAFMFLVNMFGAILLLPGLAAYIVGDRLKGEKALGVEWGDVTPEDMHKVTGTGND